MKYYELELNGETIKFRLTSGNAIMLEEKTRTKFLDYIQDYSMTAIITLLMYMRRGEIENFSMKDAQKLYDDLVDAGYTMETILYDVIYECAVVSGFLKKEELEQMKVEMKEAAEVLKNKTIEALKN